MCFFVDIFILQGKELSEDAEHRGRPGGSHRLGTNSSWMNLKDTNNKLHTKKKKYACCLNKEEGKCSFVFFFQTGECFYSTSDQGWQEKRRQTVFLAKPIAWNWSSVLHSWFYLTLKSSHIISQASLLSFPFHKMWLAMLSCSKPQICKSALRFLCDSSHASAKYSVM